MTEIAIRVVGLIPKTSTERVKGGKIAKEIGIDGFTVRKAINEARTCGIPICADKNGYYIASDAKEVEKTINTMRGRIRKMQRAVNGLETWRKHQTQ